MTLFCKDKFYITAINYNGSEATVVIKQKGFFKESIGFPMNLKDAQQLKVGMEFQMKLVLVG
jgi:hypothetical protein